MKKTIAILLLLVTFSLLGCNSSHYTIDKYDWKLVTVAWSELNGDIVACSKTVLDEYAPLGVTKTVDLELFATHGWYTIKNLEDNSKFRGTYKVLNSQPIAEIYEIIIGENSGYATSTFKEYRDNRGNYEKVPTLVFTFNGYILTFQASAHI